MKKLLSKFFSFKDAKEKNIFVIFVLALIFLSIGIGLIIVFSTMGIIDSVDEQEQEEDQDQESEFIEKSGIEDAIAKKPHISDFILPSIEKLQGDSSTDILREQQTRWTAEQVEKYWIPVEQIAIDLLSEQNKESIEKIFEKSE